MTAAPSSAASQHLLDLPQAFLAEEHLAAEIEGRDTEGAACNRLLGIVDQCLLDRRVLRPDGQRFRAAEALSLGLVTRVFPAAKFEAGVMAYAKMLANDVSPRSLREMKRELWNAQFESLGEAIAAADADMAGSFASEDFKEGVAHFLEKRPARFSGR